jgi:hypothetical protein
MVYTEDPIYLNLLKLDKENKKKEKKTPVKKGKKCFKCNCILKAIGKDRKNGKNLYNDWNNRLYCKKCFIDIKKTEEFLNFFNN